MFDNLLCVIQYITECHTVLWVYKDLVADLEKEKLIIKIKINRQRNLKLIIYHEYKLNGNNIIKDTYIKLVM